MQSGIRGAAARHIVKSNYQSHDIIFDIRSGFWHQWHGVRRQTLETTAAP
jgi:hypothetical protein